VKVGFDYQWGSTEIDNLRHNQNVTYQLRNGVPFQITVYNEPLNEWVGFRKLAFFAQDQWTFRRLTANGGLRLDVQKGAVRDTQTSGPNQYAPLQHWPQIDNVPNWKDVSPRVGISYDLFGNGKTALKATLNRYVVNDGVAFQNSQNPILFNSSATRSWNDLDHDFIPQANELGPLSNSAFATAAATTHVSDDVRQGWGVRPYDWETSAGVQHQLIPQLAVNVFFTRRWFGNFSVTDNLALVPSNYDEFCMTAPSDARLGSASGGRICGLYDLNPAYTSVRPDNLVEPAKNVGVQKESWDGIDLIVNARLPHIAVAGGLTSGTDGNNTSACFVVNSPGALRFCDVSRPWRTNVRFLTSLVLPWGVDAGVTFQDNPGPERLAIYTATNAQIGPVVQFVNPARTRFSGGSATVALLQPGTTFGDRMYEIDLRLSKVTRIRGARVRLNLDLANALNGNVAITENQTYGPAYLRPTFTLQGRIIKPGVQIDF
jgi:hypothetical protein